VTKFAKGDRVKVVDLRDGTVNQGMVMATSGGKVDVAYDDGGHVRVGETFVSHDPNPPEGEAP
jgi:hypothetical protein